MRMNPFFGTRITRGLQMASVYCTHLAPLTRTEARRYLYRHGRLLGGTPRPFKKSRREISCPIPNLRSRSLPLMRFPLPKLKCLRICTALAGSHCGLAAAPLLNDPVMREGFTDHAQACYGGSVDKSMKALDLGGLGGISEGVAGETSR